MKLKVSTSSAVLSSEPAALAYDIAAYWRAVKKSNVNMEFANEGDTLITILSNETDENLHRLAEEISATCMELYGENEIPSLEFVEN